MPQADNNHYNSNDEILDIFHTIHLNQTVNNQLSSSDERIFQCLRSRSSEQLRTASIRLTNNFYRPFHSLFGPTVDSLLITDDQLSNNHQNFQSNHNRTNSHNLNRKSKNSITNSNHDLLIGFSASNSRFRLALKQIFNKLTQLPTIRSLHFFYQFLRDFIRYVNSLIRNGSINDQNDFNEISFLISDFSSSLNHQSSYLESNKTNLNNNTNSTNWLLTKQTDLLKIINSLLLDVMVSFFNKNIIF